MVITVKITAVEREGKRVRVMEREIEAESENLRGITSMAAKLENIEKVIKNLIEE